MSANDAPRLSVCVPVYNCAAFIGETLDSLLAQTYRDFEAVVVENASTDGTAELLEAVNDPRLRVVRNERTLPAGENWNRAVAETRGAYVKVLSADDVLYPTCLERQLAALDAEPDAVLVSGPRVIVDATGKKVGTRGPGRSGRVAGGELIRRMASAGTNLIGETSAVLFRREAFDAAGGFNEASPYTIDIDLWFRMLLLGDAVFLRDPLATYRVSAGSWTAAVEHRQTEDMRQLLGQLASDPRFGVTEADARRGTRNARFNTLLRRAFYALFVKEAR